MRGRTPLLDKKQIDNVANYLNSRHGKGYKLANIKQAIKEEQRQQILDDGSVPLLSHSPSKATCLNYRAKLAAHHNVSIAQNAIRKTDSRITAKNGIGCHHSYNPLDSHNGTPA
jgi:hypothetical protein